MYKLTFLYEGIYKGTDGEIIFYEWVRFFKTKKEAEEEKKYVEDHTNVIESKLEKVKKDDS